MLDEWCSLEQRWTLITSYEQMRTKPPTFMALQNLIPWITWCGHVTWSRLFYKHVLVCRHFTQQQRTCHQLLWKPVQHTPSVAMETRNETKLFYSKYHLQVPLLFYVFKTFFPLIHIKRSKFSFTIKIYFHFFYLCPRSKCKCFFFIFIQWMSGHLVPKTGQL